MNLLVICLLCFLALLIFILCFPILYHVRLSAGGLSVSIRLAGLYAWRKDIPEKKEETDTKEKSEEKKPEKRENGMIKEERPQPPAAEENDDREPPVSADADSGEVEELALEEDMDEEDSERLESPEPQKESPSLYEQIRFAIHCGFVERTFRAVADILRHSWPGRFRIRGSYGTGDPMTTGVIAGLGRAILPHETDEIAYNYLDAVNTLQGECRGRIIPAVILWIAFRWATAGETRAFWHFRGGTYHG
jgi:hypothetical protein